MLARPGKLSNVINNYTCNVTNWDLKPRLFSLAFLEIKGRFENAFNTFLGLGEAVINL